VYTAVMVTTQGVRFEEVGKEDIPLSIRRRGITYKSAKNRWREFGLIGNIGENTWGLVYLYQEIINETGTLEKG